jgi:hypothetical protein
MCRVDAIAEAFEDFSTVFRIPPDLDDSSVNLVRRCTLATSSSQC